MSLINTINFLPEVFKTPTNQRFLGATFDQLVGDATNQPINGYIGRTFSPTYKLGDNYVPELNKNRTNYQFEPSVVVKDTAKNVTFTAGYADLLRSVVSNNGLATNHQRLFTEQSYDYTGRFDYDKFVTYNNYYWLPNGPAPVAVYSNQVPYQVDYIVTRNTAEGGYTFSTQGGQPNPLITLARGGNYTFTVDQPGTKFWIQSEPGLTGASATVPTINTRDVFGVSNNGIDTGVIRFVVPQKTAQDFYVAMPTNATVDTATTLGYTSIQGRLLSEFLREFPEGLDGINNQLQNKTFIFFNGQIDDSYWTVDSTTVPLADRTATWKINLVPIGADYIIELLPDVRIAYKEKVFVRSGKTYISTEFWVNNTNQFFVVPLITATKDYIVYQDDTGSAFVGQIKLVNNIDTPTNVPTDIIGSKGYTSPNGVVFTNGLKIEFDSSVLPASYANRQYYVDGVGTAIALTPVDQLIVPESFSVNMDTDADYITINRSSQDRNAWSRSNRWFHKDVLYATAAYNDTAVDYGPNIPGRRPIIEFESSLQLINHGFIARDTVDVIVFSAPATTIKAEGTYTIVTVGTTDFTILGASSNTVGTTFVALQNGTETDGTGTASTDAFNQIEGQRSAQVDGVTVIPGQTIIFANDYDTNVTNKVWEVRIELINGSNFIRLVEFGIAATAGENVLVRNGTSAGKTYRYTGSAWDLCQVKTSSNQSPLFDIVDADGYSLSDATVYPNSTFLGTKGFGYKIGTGNNDTVLGFPLAYQNFNNIGDIVFSNYYDTESVTYVSNQVTSTVAVNSGYFLKNSGTTTTKLNNWTPSVERSKQYQIFTKFFDSMVIMVNGVERAFVQIDVLPASQQSIPYIKVYLNNNILIKDIDYAVVPYGVYHVVAILGNTLPAVGDKIDVLVYGAETSAVGYYEVPNNLDLNPLNETFSTITLGQIRLHYNQLIENYAGTKPLQDTYLTAQGGTLVQHSAPAIYATAFLNDPLVSFTNGITLARKEYSRFKNKFLSLCGSLTVLDYNNPVTGVDTILQNLNVAKSNSFSWYYSDMVPQGGDYIRTAYTVLNARQTVYEISSIFNNLELSNRAVLVYVNGVQLTLGIGYTFSQISPAVIFTKELLVDDSIVIRDYINTDGNYIPETPSKLGIYPKFAPEIFLDTTYQTPINVIKGHDGSLTPAFGDFRDQYLLELEKRIYNNIKADYASNEINMYDIVPGRFRSTDYTLAEFNQLISSNFLNWTGANSVNYTDNSGYNQYNQFTWNYNTTPDAIDGTKLQGSWRAIYTHWYDTDRPHQVPWEMLGFNSEPLWWQDRYGAAPYTSGNATLWEDLAAGYVWNNGTNSYTNVRFVRPGLLDFIPVDSAGNLLAPPEISVTGTSPTLINGSSSYKVGEFGPAETAWRRNSDYPYAVQVALALARPAEYFATQFDTSRFYTNPVTGQSSAVSNKKINPSILVVNGDTTTGTVKRTSGYINWIADSIKNLGIDPVAKINAYLANLSVQLSYKVSGFTDKNLITVSAEQTSPGSKNASVIIPDANYDVYLSKSTPVITATYSAVIVEKTAAGYVVTGYDLHNPFFTVIPSVVNNNYFAVTVNEISTKLYQDSSKQNTTIPYGTMFTSVQQVSDFLISYERHLVAVGFRFTQADSDLGTTRNWTLSVKEFMYWAQQGWDNSTIIVLNPVVNQLVVRSVFTIIDEITNNQNGSRILDQNFVPIKNNSFTVVRTESAVNGNFFSLSVLNASTICFAKLYLVQYEHILVFDNVSDFGDVIYVPTEGTRQYRLKLAGAKTGQWTGALSAAGYIYSNPVIQNWIIDTDYKLGDIVTFNGNYYTATSKIVASLKFDFSLWAQISKSSIQTGLLPTFGHNAQKFENIYDIDRPPQEESLQLVSAGLIGFRERSYLTDLGINIANQTKFYQGYIKQKGTQNAIAALTKASVDNVNGTISTFEEWAFHVGQYGDLDSNRYKEFILDQAVFANNPAAFTVAETYSASSPIASLTMANIYTASNISSTSTAIYNDRATDFYKTDLPTAGYVNIEDVDLQVFNINSITAAEVVKLGPGSTIWAAKGIDSNWNVWRVSETYLAATTLIYTLDTYAELVFNTTHSFVPGDLLTLTNFVTLYGAFDGLYTVLNTPTDLSVTIDLMALPELDRAYLIKNSPLTANGIVYSIKSSKVPSTVYLPTIEPINGWKDNDHVWVDSATPAGWGVYTFNRPWDNTASTNVVATTPVADGAFGTAVRISSTGEYFYVGNPGQETVTVFSADQSANVTVSNASIGFGSVIESQGNLVAVSSANTVYVYQHVGNITPVYVQTISSANITSVSSISMSSDTNWLYVGGSNTVEAYELTGSQYAWRAKKSSTGSFGATIKTNADGSKLFVGAPTVTVSGYSQNGNVTVYSANALTGPTQTIIGTNLNNYANFGTSIDIDSTAGNLFIGAPGSLESGFANGLVERYLLVGSNYVLASTILHPRNEPGSFGTSISLSGDGKVLAVGSFGSPAEETTIFDENQTVIDAGSTAFIDSILNSGSVYMFEPLFNQVDPTDVGLYQFIQELETNYAAQLRSGDNFGAAIDVSRTLIVVGAPGTDTATLLDTGAAYSFNNTMQSTGWTLGREKQPMVDINSISRTFIYNKSNNNILAALDFIDPNKGKVLTSVARDIDYQVVTDPANYNAGTGKLHSDYHWGPGQLGKIWWNLDTVRYVDYEQGSLSYRLNHWAEQFPGSMIDVYEWAESLVLPSQYIANGGDGTPVHADNSAYCTYGYVDQSGNVKLKYYFWVSGASKANTKAGKQNSIYSIAAAIENPRSQGIPYAMIMRNDSVALHNVNRLLTGSNSVVHLGSKTMDAGLIHSEYTLVQEGNLSSRIPLSLLSKLIDSMSGEDAAGNVVPDPLLSAAQKFGISIRPRQSIFMDAKLAWSNYLSIVNVILAAYPVVERKVLTTLNSREAAPSSESGEYSITVNTINELTYIDPAILIPNVSKVLVLTDSTNQTKWAIYLWNGLNWTLTRVQSYKTNLYWTYVDWYDSTFDPTTTVDYTVTDNLDFGKLTLRANTYVKILNAGNNKFAIYYINSALTRVLVGIESGTIQINTANNSIPGKETRQIMLAMQTDILIDDLATEFNNVFFALIKYTLSEQKNLDWVFKTSFLAATQYIRKLEQFPSYISDNQDYYLNYINEVKPYRTILREFVVNYNKDDQYSGDTTDFDLAPYWDANLSVYRSPSGEQEYDSTIRSTGTNSQWNSNYLYKVVDIRIDRPGTGYLFNPEVIVTGDGIGATATATIDSFGAIAQITITNPGAGYLSAPTVVINGTGTGAVATAVLRNVYDGNNTGHNLVRGISTNIKFDRVTYNNTRDLTNNADSHTILFWDTIHIGDELLLTSNIIINKDNELYQLTSNSNITITGNVITNVTTFPLADVSIFNAADFTNANDRIRAYNRDVNFAATTDGIEYPGVIVDGNTYIGTKFDSTIESAFSTNVGANPAGIIIDGGSYVDQYASHAPQELVPGRMFDSVNMQVYDTTDLAFRLFDNMAGDHSFYRIAAAYTAVLSADLHITDTEIHLVDASVLPNPNTTAAVPGVVFIAGEKITYYVRDLVTNTLSQLRRAVDGTGSQSVHAAGSLVIDASVQQIIPDTSITSIVLPNNTVYTTTDYVSFGIIFDTPISANIGDTIIQRQADSTITVSMRTLETVTNAMRVPVIIISGAVSGLPEVFDGPLGFDVERFDNVGGVVYINEIATESLIVTSYKLGTVDLLGRVTVPTNTKVDTCTAWYNSGAGTIAGLPEVYDDPRGFDIANFDNFDGATLNGQGLYASTTPQSQFLKASKGDRHHRTSILA